MPFPPSNKLTVAEVFDPRTNKPKPEVLKQHFILEGRLDEATALKIIKGGAAILKDEDTMIELEAPVTGEKMFFITSSSLYLLQINKLFNCTENLLTRYNVKCAGIFMDNSTTS